MSPSHKPPSNAYTYGFMVVLCFFCALTLSILASALKAPQAKAETLDRSKQMLIAAKILSPEGHFLVRNPDDGSLVPAHYTTQGKLAPTSQQKTIIATTNRILRTFQKRITPFLVEEDGDTMTFKEAEIDEAEYLTINAKYGYADLPLKLIYKILPNPTDEKDSDAEDPEGYIIPVTGFGLWDRVYGYLAIKPDGNHVIGIAWYKHAETPGLGANIASPKWQDLFPGKVIFQMDATGETDFAAAPLGISVRRGKVIDELGDSPKAQSAVDGMSGATLTGVGISKAYKDSLEPYRAFLIGLHDQWAQKRQQKS